MGLIKRIQIICSNIAMWLWLIPLIELYKLWRGFKEKGVNMDNAVKKYEKKHKLIIICIIFAGIFSLVSIVMTIFS